jgi:hypothetical protein
MPRRSATKRNPYKPGPGWRRTANPSVWQHISGLRVHVFGIVRLASGRIVTPALFAYYRHRLWWLQRANGLRDPQHGGHRAILAWALWVASQEEPLVALQERTQ